MRFKGLDLNLMVAFDVLVDERNVSAAARRLNMTQPAMSAALARLRDYFKDDILMVSGRRMMPTAYADRMSGMVKAILGDVQILVSTSAQFEPETSERVFRIATSDYVTEVLITPLAARLAQIAPGIRLELRFPNEATSNQLDNGEIDLFVSPEEYLAQNQPSELLFEEQYVVAAWTGNTEFGAEIDEETFYRLGHVSVMIGNRPVRPFAERRMDTLQRARRVEIFAPSFSTVPRLLINSPRISVMHKRLAATVAAYLPIRTVPMPFEFPTMREMVQFHRTNALDVGLTWLRKEMQVTASEWHV